MTPAPALAPYLFYDDVAVDLEGQFWMFARRLAREST
jgi:hypothetical protein